MAVVPKLRLRSRIGEERSLRQSWLGSLSVKRKATNSCIQNRKSKSSRTPLKRPFPAETNPLDFDPYAPNPEEVLLQDDGSTLVRKAPEKPQPNFREVLILRELQGLVRCTGPASNARYHEAHGKLRPGVRRAQWQVFSFVTRYLPDERRIVGELMTSNSSLSQHCERAGAAMGITSQSICQETANGKTRTIRKVGSETGKRK
jgi:hypothetical protein